MTTGRSAESERGREGERAKKVEFSINFWVRSSVLAAICTFSDDDQFGVIIKGRRIEKHTELSQDLNFGIGELVADVFFYDRYRNNCAMAELFSGQSKKEKSHPVNKLEGNGSLALMRGIYLKIDRNNT